MIKNVNANELVWSNLLVEEPVAAVNDLIDSNISKRKIILAGSRGMGKSVVLNSRQINSVGTDEPEFLTRFDSVGIFGTKDSIYSSYFDDDFIQHYYEVMMCKYFLDYIEKYYPELYNSKFLRLQNANMHRVSELDKYINNLGYDRVALEQRLFSGEVLSEIISLFRRGTNAKSLTLMIDRFDWTHNSDPRAQFILSNYFEMFEKVIITSDDPTIMKEKRKHDLEEGGFEVVNFGYSHDPNVVRAIVEKRFLFDDTSLSKKFPLEDVDYDDYERLTERCEGNIDTILDSFGKCEILYKWSDDDFDISKGLAESCTEKLDGVKKLRKMCRPQRFHL